MSAAVRALARAAKLLPRERRQWIEALVAECDQLEPGPERRRWIAGGVWLLLRQYAAEPLHRPTWTLRAAVAATVALMGVNLVQYPELVSQSPATAVAFVSLYLALLAGYRWQIQTMIRRGGPELVRRTVGLGLLAGLLLLGALVLANVDSVRHRWPVAVELGFGGGAALAFAAASIGWARTSRPAAIRGGLYAGITAGLTVFVGGVGLAMAFLAPSDGASASTVTAVRHDPHALAIAAAGDTLSGAISLLVWIPLLAMAVGLVVSGRNPRA
jgi:hypothetical protein